LLDRKVGAIDGKIMGCGDWELLAVLEGPVLDQFGVDATVTGVVDVLYKVSERIDTQRNVNPTSWRKP
jgi:hypothetical protein